MTVASTSIDPKIKPLVDAMNATGHIRTVASCQGHFYRCPPYVYFYAPVTVASAIDRALRTLVINDDAVLKRYWQITANFDQEFKLAFRLSCSELDETVWSFIRGVWNFVVRRSLLDAELLAIGHVVRLAVKLEMGEADKPEVAEEDRQHDNKK